MGNTNSTSTEENPKTAIKPGPKKTPVAGSARRHPQPPAVNDRKRNDPPPQSIGVSDTLRNIDPA